jgi:hypothetical protein
MAYASAAFRQSISTDSEVYYWDRPDIADEDTFFMLSRGRDGWNWKYLVRRFGAAPAWVIVSILDDTVGRGAFGPEYATLDYEELSTVHHLCIRQLQNIVRKLARDGVFLRHPDSDLLVKVDMSRLREAPVRSPLVKPRKPPVRESAEMHFREKLAAFVQVAPVSAAPVAEMHFRESVTDFPLPETYCPWKWSCPHLDNDLAGDKNFKNGKNSISSSSLEEPTTTGSATDVASPHAAPVPEPSPEQRIAEPAPDRRDTVNSASVRPLDRTERKRAVPRPPQRPSKNGGDRPDGGSRQTDGSRTVEQNTTLLRDPVHCPTVVAEAVRDTLGAADQSILGQIWAGCGGGAQKVTDAELAQLVRRAAWKVRRHANRSPHRYLLSCLLEDLRGPDILNEVRRGLAEAERQAERERQSIREHYADPDTSEETKKWLREHHDFLSK